MDIINTGLGIIASVFGIVTAIIGLINNKEIKKISNNISNNKSNNKQKLKGDNSIQINGNNNKV